MGQQSLLKFLLATGFCFFIILSSTSGQDGPCGNCKLTPSVAMYDFDMQVPQTADKGDEYMKWLNLHWVGKHARLSLFQNNRGCVRFTQPPTIDNENVEILTFGETFTNLPPRGDLSKYANYILTGHLRSNGNGYIFRLEVQGACNRKVVASSEVAFELNGETTPLAIAREAAAKMTPLVERIRKFELEEREKNDMVGLSGWGEESIIIKPAKYSLTSGEETQLSIEIKDCDGKPLKNREIIFTKGELNGFPISGTTGGTVTPSKVISDGNGKAKATFRMGNSRKAVINAHHIFNTPNGCRDGMTGSVSLGMPHFKIFINYEKEGSSDIEWKGGDEIMSMTLADEEKSYSVFSNTVVYVFPGTAKVRDLNVQIVPYDNESINKMQVLVNKGYSFSFNRVKSPEITVHPLEATHKVARDSIITISSNSPMSPQISIEFEGDSLSSFDFTLDFPDKGDHTPDSGGFLAIRGNKDTEIKSRKLTQAGSPYTTEYIVKFFTQESTTNNIGSGGEVQQGFVRILSTY